MVIDSLELRKSVRLFDGSKLDALTINHLVRICNLTPTSLGIQPVRLMTIASDKFKELLTPATYNQPQVKSCSHLFVFAIKNSYSHSEVEEYIKLISETRGETLDSLEGFKTMILKWMENFSDEDYKDWATNQAYITLGNLVTSCATMDIDACAMEGFNKSQYDEILKLKSKDLSSVIICAVGKRAEGDPRGKEKKVRLKNCEYHIQQF